MRLENVVRLVELRVVDGIGASDRRKESAKEASKNRSRVSSANMTIRNVGRVIWSGFAGSRAAFARLYVSLE